MYTYALTSPTPNGLLKFGDTKFNLVDSHGRPTSTISRSGSPVAIEGSIEIDPNASDTNPLAGAISGYACISVGFESIGDGPEFTISVHVPLKSCENGSYPFRLEIDKSNFSNLDLSNKCGAVYLAGHYTQIYNDCGQPMPINGFSPVPVMMAVSQ